jgi:hypothetical protein
MTTTLRQYQRAAARAALERARVRVKTGHGDYRAALAVFVAACANEKEKP